MYTDHVFNRGYQVLFNGVLRQNMQWIIRSFVMYFTSKYGMPVSFPSGQRHYNGCRVDWLVCIKREPERHLIITTSIRRPNADIITHFLMRIYPKADATSL